RMSRRLMRTYFRSGKIASRMPTRRRKKSWCQPIFEAKAPWSPAIILLTWTQYSGNDLKPAAVLLLTTTGQLNVSPIRLKFSVPCKQLATKLEPLRLVKHKKTDGPEGISPA